MKSISIRYGLRMGLALLVLFSVAHLAGAVENPSLRWLNGIVHIGFIYLALRKYRIEFGREWNYASGVGIGVLAGMIGTLLFAVAVGIFLGARPDVLAEIASHTRLGAYLNPVTAAAVMVVEGFAVTAFASYFCMRIVDSDRRAKAAAAANARVRPAVQPPAASVSERSNIQ